MEKIKRADNHLFYRGDRVLNFRPLVFVSLSFGLGIFLSFLWGIRALWLCLVWPIVCIFALFWRRKEKSVWLVLFSLALCLVFSVGVFSFGMRINQFEQSPALAEKCVVRGTLERIDHSQKTDALTFGEVVLITETGQRIETNFYIRVYVYGGTQLQLGIQTIFSATVETYDAWSYGKVNASAIIEKVRYHAFAEEEDFFILSDGKANIFGSVRERLHEELFSSMDEPTAAIAYAMLTGDSGEMDDDVLQNFRYGGIAHIFAVSGLHIGVVYGICNGFLKKLRLRSWIRCPIVSLLLIFYAGVCGFSPSSVRALVMCMVLMAMEAGGFAYDRVNSVSIAALIVLLIHPVHLFSVGFQLSIAAAAGIIILGAQITRLLRRLHLPYSVCAALGTTISAQFATFPLLLDCFGYASGIGLALNLVFVPLLSLVYLVLFISAFLACAVPAIASWALFIPAFLLRICVLPILSVEWKFGIISGFSFGALALIWYLIGIICSDKVNLKIIPKAGFVILFSIALTFGMCARNHMSGVQGAIYIHSYYGTNLLLVRQSDSAYLISSADLNESDLERFLLRERITHLDGIIFLASVEEIGAELPVVLQYVSIDVLYVSAQSNFINSYQTIDVQEVDDFFGLGNGSAIFLNEYTLYFRCMGAGVLINFGDIPDHLLDCDILIAEKENFQLLAVCEPTFEIYFNQTEGKTDTYSAGDLQILWKDDIIFVTDRDR